MPEYSVTCSFYIYNAYSRFVVRNICETTMTNLMMSFIQKTYRRFYLITPLKTLCKTHLNFSNKIFKMNQVMKVLKSKLPQHRLYSYNFGRYLRVHFLNKLLKQNMRRTK